MSFKKHLKHIVQKNIGRVRQLAFNDLYEIIRNSALMHDTTSGNEKNCVVCWMKSGHNSPRIHVLYINRFFLRHDGCFSWPVPIALREHERNKLLLLIYENPGARSILAN